MHASIITLWPYIKLDSSQISKIEFFKLDLKLHKNHIT